MWVAYSTRSARFPARSKGRCTCWPKGSILMETAVIEAGTGGGACSSGGWTAGASGGA